MQQLIGVGAAADDHTGDPVRSAFIKVNQNFSELYWPQRRVTASPITIGSGDVVINCAISSGSPTCNLPSASGRAGVPLIFKDCGGYFAAHPLTLTPTSGDAFDGLSTITLSTNYQRIQLRPYNDGTTTGWSVES
jgi:hypothetical protein